MKVEDREEWKLAGKETGIAPLELDTEPTDNIHDHKVHFFFFVVPWYSVYEMLLKFVLSKF